MMDGWIRVGTKVDDKGIDDGIKEIQKKINVAEQQKLVVETDMKNTKQELTKVNSYIDDTQAKLESLKSTFSTSILRADRHIHDKCRLLYDRISHQKNLRQYKHRDKNRDQRSPAQTFPNAEDRHIRCQLADQDT